MSKIVGRDRFGEEQYLKHEYDIKHQRSITPDTHKSRVLIKDADELRELAANFQLAKQPVVQSSSLVELEDSQNQQQIETFTSNPFYYLDEYQYKDSNKSHVLHFGINTYRDKLIKEILDINQEQKVKFDLSSLSKGTEDKKFAAITKFQEQAEKTLTDYEKSIVQNAVDYLLASSTQKTVLIDFFVRDADNKVQFNDTDEKDMATPKTHTVVLYSQKGKFLLVDPSDATHSYLLTGANKDIIICINEKMLIYKPLASDQTGYDSYKWRDCTDIAVKLAFGLNNNNNEIKITNIKHKQNSVEVIDFTSLKNNPIIKDITNQNSLYALLPSEVKDYPIRSKQSSDIKESAKTTWGLKSLSSTFIKIEEKLQDINPYRLIAKYDQKREKALSNPSEKHAEFIQQLGESADYFKNELTLITHNQDYVQNEELRLIGELE